MGSNVNSITAFVILQKVLNISVPQLPCHSMEITLKPHRVVEEFSKPSLELLLPVLEAFKF